jgi:UDP-N-acetylmuramyl pentapeptide phosphotransferase/UDP-N-acetylglucosamine-1-phosphate transferase
VTALAALLVAAAACGAALWILLRFASRLPLDRPNARSLHEEPVPRVGGIGLVAGMLAAVAGGLAPFGLALALAGALAAVSLADDFRPLPTTLRLVVHLCAAGVLVWYVLSPMHVAAMVILALAVAWITNLYNFMDGSDGLAAGMSIFGFGAYAIAAWLAGDLATALVASALVGAAAAFLVFNFPPARVFLGDVGSIPLGFLVGALGIIGWRNDAWPLWFPVAVFGPFIADATLTLFRRLVRGDPVWRAHREHYYQRAVRMGFGHRGTALGAYAVMLACAAAALLGREQSPSVQAAAFGTVAAILAALAAWIDMRWRRSMREPREA